jgi:hypothetical protein
VEDRIANRAALKVRGTLCDNGAEADARAEFFVRGLEPRGDVDGIAIGRVVEEPRPAEIADDRRTGVDTNPCYAEPSQLLLARTAP